MNQAAAARLDSITRPATGLLWIRLNADQDGRSLGQRFRYQECPGNKKGHVFEVVEKAPTGQAWPEGKWRNHGGLTRRQAEILEATSQTDEELVERIVLLVIHKKDTTSVAQPEVQQALSPDEIRAMIVEEAKKLAHQMVESAKHEVGQGVQHKPRKSPKEYGAAIDKELQLWTDRAALVGGEPPVIRKRDRRIDGRWLRRFTPKWEAYVASQTPEGKTAAT